MSLNISWFASHFQQTPDKLRVFSGHVGAGQSGRLAEDQFASAGAGEQDSAFPLCFESLHRDASKTVPFTAVRLSSCL